MGVEGFELRRLWPIVVAMNAVVVFITLIDEPSAAPGPTRPEQVVLDIQQECAEHICCRSHGGCTTPRGRWLPDEADDLSGRLEEQAIEILDAYPDRFTACEIIDSLEPRSLELEAICHPPVVTEPPEPLSREELQERIRERDDQISALLEGQSSP